MILVTILLFDVGMKPLSERDENSQLWHLVQAPATFVGMKPLSERDENFLVISTTLVSALRRRNEATL